MVAESFTFIGSELRQRLAEIPGERILSGGESVQVVGQAGHVFLTVSIYDDRWLIETEKAHAHFDEAEEAVAVAVNLLQGRARFTEEYRDSTLAAGWLETLEDGGYTVSNRACFLDPFDVDEWLPLAGETWKQIRKILSVDPETGDISERVQERELSAPPRPPDSTQWLKDGLGSPVDGMKWVVGVFPRFVFQAPSGWRRVKESSGEYYVSFAPVEQGLVFRAQTYTRGAAPGHEKLTVATGPISIDTKIENDEPEWRHHTWSLVFTDHETEYMGILELFSQEEFESEGAALREKIQSSVSLALLAPDGDWDMTRS